MQYTTLLLAAAALGLASAQTTTSAATGATTSGTSGCGTAIDNIINACLASTSTQAESCGAIDWDCKCTAQQTVNTCYNNCPSDPRAFGSKQQEDSWCAAAKAYPSTSSSVAVSSSTASSSSSSASATPSGAMMPSGTSSGSGASSTTKASAAVGMAIPASGFLAAMFGVAAALL